MVNVRRVVTDPRHPLAALFELVERPEDIEELLALRARVDPLAAAALKNIALVAPADRYSGPRAALVMGPFLNIWPSRFSPGTYGVLYTAQNLDVATREHGFHLGLAMLATHAPASMLPRSAIDLKLDDSTHRDIRAGGAHDVKNPAIYDPNPNGYGAAQALGASVRAAGGPGLRYDSVRAPGGTCYGTFRPAAVRTVGAATTELELVWDGTAIVECREIRTHHL